CSKLQAINLFGPASSEGILIDLAKVHFNRVPFVTVNSKQVKQRGLLSRLLLPSFLL
ncbi:hypothetical protein BgiMline_010639, partial [Biomphalaria glabrata]